MKRSLLLTLFLTLFIGLLFVGSQSSHAGGQNQTDNNSANKTDGPLASKEKEDIVIGSSRKTGGATDLEEEETEPDFPKGRRGNMDESAYLRLRDEYIARLRGIEPGRPFDSGARGRAIRQMESAQTLRAESSKDSFFNKLTSVFGSETPLASIWTELGPRPLPNGSAQSGIVPVSGRTTAVVVDPTNPNKVYLGTAQGGVWRSLDAGVNWTPIFDSAQSLAIGALAIAPSSPTTLYVGTGEFNGCGDCFFGVGLYRIDNADTSATLVGPINPSQTIGNLTYKVFNGRGITKILVDPNNAATIFVSTGRGIGGQGANALGITPNLGGSLAPRGVFRSTNATAAAASITFEKLTVTTDSSVDAPATGNVDTPDMALEPGNASNLIVSVVGLTGGGGIYRTTTALNPNPTFSQSLSLGNGIRANLAIANVGGAVTVYAATGETPNVNASCTTASSGAVRKSVDGGLSWSTQLGGGQGFCGGQCFYDMPIAVDPNNANIVYLGGNARGTCSDAMKKSIDGGTSFQRDDNGLHADSHALFFDGAGLIYTGNDGGVWKRSSSSSAGSAWTNLNRSPLSTLQFESIAVHPLDQFFTIGGTQDNGTEAQQSSSGNWKNAEGGDGGYTLIDQSATNNTNVTMYLTFFNESNSQIFFDRATLTSCLNVRNSWPSRGAIACGNAPCADDNTLASGCDNLPFLKNNGIQLTDNVLFYAPMALGPGSPNILYFGTDRLYRSTDRGDNMTIVSQSPLQPTGSRTPLGGGAAQTTGTPISTIAVSPQDDNYRIVGMQNGPVWATSTGSATMVNITGGSFPANPNGSVTNKFVGRAIFDPSNKDVAYISFSFFAPAGQGIWKITNLGAAGSSAGAPNWVPAANGIPSIPINALAVDPTNSNNVFAGTDIGVYNSTDGGASWAPFGTGLPRVAVFGMAIQPTSRILRVATHGRGMWEISLNAAPGPNTVQFNSFSQAASETPNQTTKVDVTITRTGDITGAATIDYATSDGTASSRSDYEAAIGTLRFAANEGTKTISVFIVDDRFGEGPETFNINLSNPVGCTLGSPASFTVTINSNESVDGLNPVKDASFDTDFFVRQHYIDFFNRAPDDGGLAFWKNQIDSCTDQACREIRRINVSGAFFLAIEFQQTGYLVERLYKTAYGDNTSATSTLGGTHQLSVPIIRFNEFLPDTQEIGRGVVIGQPGADQLLENNKQTLIAEFVARPRFITAYPLSMTPAQFVDQLNLNAGGPLSPTERNQLVSDLNSGAKTRAQVLRAVAEDPDLFTAEQNRAFVLAQYFGYLRRNPNDAPDSDFSGYEFWLNKLNQFNGNFVNAEMVKSFIVSSEYQNRFGP
ncbi:MAG: hypothetical protein QOF62_3866 [Pyrinomonadaceae bacterium]|jgi:hypothetical protein|nr:hypothetical protein [Pyrinomonadaceae bacterium]